MTSVQNLNVNPGHHHHNDALKWIRKELDEVLEQARKDLEACVEDDQEHLLLPQVKGSLHQIKGILQMVDLHGATMLAQEMEDLTQALIDGVVRSKDDVYETLLRAMLQLPDYLEHIEAGNRDVPVMLLPLLNDLRSTREAELLSEKLLFFPDIENTPIPQISSHSSERAQQDVLVLAKRLRHVYQLGLLGWFRNQNVASSLARMRTVTSQLYEAAQIEASKRFWWVTSALTEALEQNALESSMTTKSLLGKIDREIKHLAEKGEEESAKHIPEELIKNILYYTACAEDKGRIVREVKKTFALTELLPRQSVLDEMRDRLSAPNAEVFRTVAGAINEDLNEVKDKLEIFINKDSNDVNELNILVQKLHQIGDTLDMLSLNAARDKVLEEAAFVNDVINGEKDASETAIMNMAGVMLEVESSIENVIASRHAINEGGQTQQSSDQLSSKEVDEISDPERRNLQESVVSEALSDVAKTKDAILNYVASPDEYACLGQVPDNLRRIGGALDIAGIEDASFILSSIEQYISSELLENQVPPGNDKLEILADAITRVECFLESILTNKKDPSSIFEAAITSIKNLGYPANAVSDNDDLANVYPSDKSNEEFVGDSKIEDSKNASADAALQAAGSDSSPVVSAEDSIAAPLDTGLEVAGETDAPTGCKEKARDVEYELQFPVLVDGVDKEILEIFLEEAEEETNNIRRWLPAWQLDNSNEEVLADLRRSFHTLKGSGRLVGAQLMGEFAWAFENLLNRVIDKSISVTQDLFDELNRAAQILPDLICQIEDGSMPAIDPQGIMQRAHTLCKPETQSEKPVESKKKTSVSDLIPDLNSNAKQDDIPSHTEETSINNFGDSFKHAEASNDHATKDALTSKTDPTPNLRQPDEQLPPAEPDSQLSNHHDNKNNDSLSDLLQHGQDFDNLSGATNQQSDPQVFSAQENSIPSEGSESGTVNVNQCPTPKLVDIAVAQSSTGSREELPDTGESPYSEPLAVRDYHIEQIDFPPPSSPNSSQENTHEMSARSSVSMVPSSAERQHFNETVAMVQESETPAVGSSIQPVNDNEVSVPRRLQSEGYESSESEVQTGVDHVTIDSGAGQNQFQPHQGDNRQRIDSELLAVFDAEVNQHLNTLDQTLNSSQSVEEGLPASKDLIRALHTLNGSARTAEVPEIARLCGPLEHYVKDRADTDHPLAEQILPILRDLISNIRQVLRALHDSNVSMPDDSKLRLRINALIESPPTEQGSDSGQILIEIPKGTSHTDFSCETNNKPDANVSCETVTKADDFAEVIPDQPGEQEQELLEIFLEEAADILHSIDESIQNWDASPQDFDTVKELQRYLHTLKGGARMAGLTTIGDLSHTLESLIIAVVENRVNISAELFKILHQSFDRLHVMLESAEKRQSVYPAPELIRALKQLKTNELPSQNLTAPQQAVRGIKQQDAEVFPEEGNQERVTPIGEARIGLEEHEEQANIAGTGPSKYAESGTENKLQPGKHPHSSATRQARATGSAASGRTNVVQQELIRVRSDLLDSLVNNAGEVNIYHSRLAQQISAFGFNLNELDQTVVRLRNQLRKLEIETEAQILFRYEQEKDKAEEDFDPLELDRYSTIQQLSRALGESVSDLVSIKDILVDHVKDTDTLLLQQSRVSTDLQEGLMRTRMVQFSGLAPRLRRIARQTANELDKKVELLVSGESSEVDRSVLDRMVAPLEHMLRNAISHGIESPDQRQEGGKPETGTIHISVEREGSEIVIRVEDDGLGIDLEAVRKKALRQGLIKENDKLSNHELMQFILESGFSTAGQVTQISGRGVGMDVVNSEIKQLGGVLSIDSTRGKGTVFTVRLPFTLAINKALLVHSGDEMFAIPLASIEGIVRLTAAELKAKYALKTPTYEYVANDYKLKHLGVLLGICQPMLLNPHEMFPVLLVRAGEHRAALQIESIVGNREIVVKPVGPQISRARGISGATILGDGRVVLILDVAGLMRIGSGVHLVYMSEQPEETSESEKVHRVMVVDDSITIRKITTKMLERNNFAVLTAKDGLDAINQLQDIKPDLMLLDIEMPRMDGYELATHMRNNDALKSIPIIMITSRTGEKHRQRAREIGVNKYLGKPYQESDLLENIHDMLQQSGTLT
jgi:chemosensory pili system protein ChpA (sensor histidine kinase/response regulator)